MSTSASFDLANSMLRMMGLPMLQRKDDTVVPAASANPEITIQDTMDNTTTMNAAGDVPTAKQPGRISRLWQGLVLRLKAGWTSVKCVAVQAKNYVAESRMGQATKRGACAAGRCVKKACAPAFNWIAKKVLQGGLLVLRGIAAVDERFEGSAVYAWIRVLVVLTAAYFVGYGLGMFAAWIAGLLFSWVPGVLGALLTAAFGIALTIVLIRAFFGWLIRAVTAYKADEAIRTASESSAAATGVPSQPTEESTAKKS